MHPQKSAAFGNRLLNFSHFARTPKSGEQGQRKHSKLNEFFVDKDIEKRKDTNAL